MDNAKHKQTNQPAAAAAEPFPFENRNSLLLCSVLVATMFQMSMTLKADTKKPFKEERTLVACKQVRRHNKQEVEGILSSLVDIWLGIAFRNPFGNNSNALKVFRG